MAPGCASPPAATTASRASNTHFDLRPILFPHFRFLLRSHLAKKGSGVRRANARIADLWSQRSSADRVQGWHMVRLLLICQRVGPYPPAVDGRRHAHDAAKDGAEVALVAESNLLADTGH